MLKLLLLQHGGCLGPESGVPRCRQRERVRRGKLRGREGRLGLWVEESRGRFHSGR